MGLYLAELCCVDKLGHGGLVKNDDAHSSKFPYSTDLGGIHKP